MLSIVKIGLLKIAFNGQISDFIFFFQLVFFKFAQLLYFFLELLGFWVKTHTHTHY